MTSPAPAPMVDLDAIRKTKSWLAGYLAGELHSSANSELTVQEARNVLSALSDALSHIDSLSTPVQVNKAIPSMDSILAEMAGETAPVQGEVEELRKQVAEWSALATINNTLWQARAETAEASAAALKLRVVELEVALRPFADAEGVVQACASQGVPLFLKQLGAAPTSAGRRIILPHHSNHNDDPQHWPDKFRVQRFPEAA